MDGCRGWHAGKAKQAARPRKATSHKQKAESRKQKAESRKQKASIRETWEPRRLCVLGRGTPWAAQQVIHVSEKQAVVSQPSVSWVGHPCCHGAHGPRPRHTSQITRRTSTTANLEALHLGGVRVRQIAAKRGCGITRSSGTHWSALGRTLVHWNALACS